MPGSVRRGVAAIFRTQASSVLFLSSRQSAVGGKPEVCASSMRRVMAALSVGQSRSTEDTWASSASFCVSTRWSSTTTLKSCVPEAMGMASSSR